MVAQNILIGNDVSTSMKQTLQLLRLHCLLLADPCALLIKTLEKVHLINSRANIQALDTPRYASESSDYKRLKNEQQLQM